MKNPSLRWPEIAARVTAGIFGAYACSWGLAAAATAALVGLGVAYHDAEVGSLMAALLLFLGLLLWSFAAVSVARVWLVLIGGAASLFTLAWAIQRAILA